MEMEEAKFDIFPNPHRGHPRPQSEARVRYYKPRRDAGTRTRRYAARSAQEKTGSNFKARMVFQATICGGFLALLLFFNIIDTGFTNAVTGWIEQSISFDMLAEEGGVVGWVNSLLGIFENDEQAAPAHYEVYMPYTGAGIENPAEAASDFSRIDESILREINSRVDIYYENNR